MSDLFDFAADLARAHGAIVSASVGDGSFLRQPPDKMPHHSGAATEGFLTHDLPAHERALGERNRVLADLRVRRRALAEKLNVQMMHLARSRPTRIASADDAMRFVAEMPEAAGLDPRWVGVVWRLGPWVKTGQYVPSLRRENHARPIPLWRLDDGAGVK